MERPETVGQLTQILRHGGYIADRGLATALFVSLSLDRPILLEGEVGVGKTEVAKVLASVLDRRLIRLQCSTEASTLATSVLPTPTSPSSRIGRSRESETNSAVASPRSAM